MTPEENKRRWLTTLLAGIIGFSIFAVYNIIFIENFNGQIQYVTAAFAGLGAATGKHLMEYFMNR